MPDEPNTLAGLRQRIDEIDTAIHDLLMTRSEIAERIGEVKGETRVYIRPGREAIVLRRLIERHRGVLPSSLIVRIWREIFAAVTALQGAFAVAVYAPEGSFGYRNLARDQYGWRTPITAYRSAAQVLEAVGDGRATVGVLPLPGEDGIEPWWRNLARDGASVPRVVARLPFATIGTSGGDGPQGLAISVAMAEETGEDHAFIVIETGQLVSRSHLKQLIGEAGFDVLDIQIHAEGDNHALNLIEVEGFVPAEDERLTRLTELGEGKLSHVWAVGGYAVPVTLHDNGAPSAGSNNR